MKKGKREIKKIIKRDGFKLSVIGAACFLFVGFAGSRQTRNIANNDLSQSLSFDKKAEISKAAFTEVYKVFMSPRCANCHSGGDNPTQNDEMALHDFDVVRGDDGNGEIPMKCATCHQTENIEGEHLPPGVSSGWRMPPANMKMVFQGRTAKQLCEQFKDPLTNGGKKTLAVAMEHLEKDPLVLWGWSPGTGRTTPPLSHQEFMKNIKLWVENGGACPD